MRRVECGRFRVRDAAGAPVWGQSAGAERPPSARSPSPATRSPTPSPRPRPRHRILTCRVRPEPVPRARARAPAVRPAVPVPQPAVPPPTPTPILRRRGRRSRSRRPPRAPQGPARRAAPRRAALREQHALSPRRRAQRAAGRRQPQPGAEQPAAARPAVPRLHRFAAARLAARARRLPERRAHQRAVRRRGAVGLDARVRDRRAAALAGREPDLRLERARRQLGAADEGRLSRSGLSRRGARRLVRALPRDRRVRRARIGDWALYAGVSAFGEQGFRELSPSSARSLYADVRQPHGASTRRA